MAEQKKALLTGISGMDASYLADFLIEKGYKVFGLMRRSSNENLWRLWKSRDKITIIYGDLTDQSSLDRAIQQSNPDEVYNLAAQSFVGSSFQHPEQTSDVTGLGCLRMLEAIRKFKPTAKYYQASSSEMFGKVVEVPQTEKTPFYPRSPYGCAKVFAYWITVNYRESYGIFSCNGILFNHTGPRRGPEFVSKKISTGVAKIKLGSNEPIVLGNINSERDFGYAYDYVQAMWLMLQQETPDDYVIATGETHSIREFVEEAFKVAGLEIEWEGEGLNKVAKLKNYFVASENGKIVVRVSPEFYRPAEVDLLIGDATKAKEKLGWVSSTPFPKLVRLMVEKDVERLSK